MGDIKVPNTPTLGSVCLAVGALNLNLFNPEIHAKNIKFLILI
jgi:hypothetical protein